MSCHQCTTVDLPHPGDQDQLPLPCWSLANNEHKMTKWQLGSPGESLSSLGTWIFRSSVPRVVETGSTTFPRESQGVMVGRVTPTPTPWPQDLCILPFGNISPYNGYQFSLSWRIALHTHTITSPSYCLRYSFKMSFHQVSG